MKENNLNYEGLVSVKIYNGKDKPPMKFEVSKEYYDTCESFRQLIDNELKKMLIKEDNEIIR